MMSHVRRSSQRQRDGQQAQQRPHGAAASAGQRCSGPGKTTLIELQAPDTGPDRNIVSKFAAHSSNGTHRELTLKPSGAPSELPFHPTLEALFGTPLGSVRAYLGQHAELAPYNAHAAAWHESVAFAGPPTLPLAAHEVAHVVQLRSGTPEQCFSQADDASEHEADFVAHAVAGGASQVSVHATRTAAVSFSLDPGPVPASAPVTLLPVVHDAIDRAQKDQSRRRRASG